MKRLLPLLLLLAPAGCTPVEEPPSQPPRAEWPPLPADFRYEARGQEPGWYLLIHGDRMDFTGDYGETKISASHPFVRASFNGLRYETAQLTVDVTYSRCNDAMSGFGFEHRVMVTAGRRTYDGCGGKRKPEWDM
jgi:uncharacterized membrane protein